MGLLVEGGYLYVMGDGGLRRMPWTPGRFSDKSEMLVKLKTGGEHDAHAISRGPDGWMYLLCGNTAGVKSSHASLVSSPIKQLTAGCVLRVSPDFQKSEIICDGFRNAYGFDWSSQGELYTFDSDNERCLGLPWYEGCRFYRIERGGHYGWRSPQKGQFWRMPPYHAMVVAPLADLGRGSPTGVVCYRHQQFPEPYHNGFFLLDWTFGVIHHVVVGQSNTMVNKFLQPDAGHGFAPTAAAIHPKSGDLFVSTGGRGTRGAVYRIRHEAGYKALPSGAGLQAPANSPTSRTLRDIAPTAALGREELLKQFSTSESADTKLRALCLLMTQLGDIGTASLEYPFKEGYQLLPHRGALDDKALVQELLIQLRAVFPANDVNLDREISRALALLKDDSSQTVDKVLARITAKSSPIDDIHYLFILGCCPAKRQLEQTKAIADALVRLDHKYDQRMLAREKNWSLRVREVFRALKALDHDLPGAIEQHPELGRPDHLLFLPDDRASQERLALRWISIVRANKEYPWSPELVALLANLRSDEVLQLFRSKWEDASLQEALLPRLAREKDGQDRPRFLACLRSTTPRTVMLAMTALANQPKPSDKSLVEELAACARALQYWHPLDKEIARRLQIRLQDLTQAKMVADPRGWTRWVIEHYPEAKAQLESSDGVDRAKWNARLQQIDWTKGQAGEGESIFRKHCGSCHQGTSALGPDLAGVGKRFNHDDLLTAILQPSKDVPARYRTTVFTTHGGQTHVGLVIYEAVDGVILQTASAGTIRIAGQEIAAKRTTEQSMMPAGLLEAMSDQQIADLLAWLKKK